MSNGNGIGRPENENAFYKRVGRAIRENEVFDWSEDTGNWPNIKWVVASYMLQDRTEWEKHKLLDSYVGQMDLYKSIDWLEQQGVSVFRSKTDGGKGRNLEYITINPAYKQAKVKEYQRLWKHWEMNTNRVKHDIEKRLPSGKTTKFITDGHEVLNELNLA